MCSLAVVAVVFAILMQISFVELLSLGVVDPKLLTSSSRPPFM